MDTDGVKEGFDLEMLKAVNDISPIPVIASGGCGAKEHILEVFEKDVADAALAASIFHYGTYTVEEVKQYLRENDIPVRL